MLDGTVNMLQAINAEGSAMEWHDGESTDVIRRRAPETVCVMADGDELMCILHRFQNLPRISPEAKRQLGPWSWFGDHAKFIIANL